MAWDWQVFCKNTTEGTTEALCWGKGGDITYLQWMFHAWGWTLSVALCAWVIAVIVGGLVGTARTLPNSPWLVRLANAWVELFRNIEERWNKGRFGKEYDECEDLVERARWDRRTGQGREKIFEVRRHCTDVTFIDDYLTEDFCREHKLFLYDFNSKTGMYQISDRDFKKVKLRLLFQLTNAGQPFIFVVDGNFRNKGELHLQHKYEGIELKHDYARDTLRNIQKIWGRPVNLDTTVDDKGRRITFDGEDFEEKDVTDKVA